MKNRLHYLDAVKGLGMLGIIFQHVNPGSADPFNLWLGTIKITCFFIVSGILLGSKESHKRSLKVTLFIRIKQLMIPYFFFSILISIVNGIVNIITKNEPIRNAAIEIFNTFSLRGNGPLWFIPVFFFGELLFLVFRRYKFSIQMIAALLGLIVSFGLGILTDKMAVSGVITLILSKVVLVFGKSILATSFFLFGGFISDLILGKSKHILALGTIAFIGSIGCATQTLGLDLNFLRFGANPIAFVFASCLGAVGITLIFKWIEQTFGYSYPVFSFASINSLLIMCTHYFFGIIIFANYIASFFPTSFGLLATVIVLIIEFFIVQLFRLKPMSLILKQK